jgi:hypothetical protein
MTKKLRQYAAYLEVAGGLLDVEEEMDVHDKITLEIISLLDKKTPFSDIVMLLKDAGWSTSTAVDYVDHCQHYWLLENDPIYASLYE